MGTITTNQTPDFRNDLPRRHSNLKGLRLLRFNPNDLLRRPFSPNGLRHHRSNQLDRDICRHRRLRSDLDLGQFNPRLDLDHHLLSDHLQRLPLLDRDRDQRMDLQHQDLDHRLLLGHRDRRLLLDQDPDLLMDLQRLDQDHRLLSDHQDRPMDLQLLDRDLLLLLGLQRDHLFQHMDLRRLVLDHLDLVLALVQDLVVSQVMVTIMSMFLACHSILTTQ